MDHLPEHEELLERALLGEGDPEGVLEARLRACPTCRAELDQLRGLARRLQGTAQGQREDVHQSLSASTERDAELVRHTLLAELGSRRKRKAARRVLLLVAAVAVALLALRFLIPSGSGPRAPEVLLGGDFELRVSLRDGRYDAIEWEHELLPGESYELCIRELVDGLVGATLATHAGLTVPRYTPMESEERAFPERMHVTVTVRSVSGEARARASLTASRR